MKASSLAAQKYLMRLSLREILRLMPERTRTLKSRKAIQALMKTKSFKKAKTVFTYLATPSEVQTTDFVKRALALKKKVYVPRLKKGTPHLEICEIQNLRTGLRKGRYGILEPVGRKSVPPQVLELIVAPGLGFDKKGNRLGRGLGYFDRFLAKVKKTPKIGLAFREQIVKQIPTESHDVRMNEVITD